MSVCSNYTLDPSTQQQKKREDIRPVVRPCAKTLTTVHGFSISRRRANAAALIGRVRDEQRLQPRRGYVPAKKPHGKAVRGGRNPQNKK